VIGVKVYQQITLLPSEEIPCHFLWEKLFQQIHLALVENKATRRDANGGNEQTAEYLEYGLSFPQYDVQLNALGSCLRVFAANREKLEKLDLFRWLERLQDYCRCTSIEAVPQKTGYARFKRRQFHTNVERMARRRAKRKQESYELALAYYSGYNEQLTRLPYIFMNSLSGKRRFPLFIEREMVTHEEHGEFSCYGLSNNATVPWF